MLKIFKSRADTNSEEIRALKEELNSKLAETNLLMEDLKRKASIAERTFTVVKKYNFDDIKFLGKISEIALSPEFQFHAYNVRTLIINQLTQGTKEDSVSLQGMLKGIDLFIESTFKAAKEYSNMTMIMEREQNVKV